MKQNNKLVSIIVALAMMITMFSSMVVVNAAETAEVYTKVVSSDETTVKVEIGYSNIEALTGMAVSSVTACVKVPEGLTASAIALSDAFTGSTENVANGNVNTDGEIKIVKFDATGNGFAVDNNATIATVDFTIPENAEAKTYEFTVSQFQIDDVDLNSIVLGNDVTASNGSFEIAPVIEGPVVYTEDAVLADGKATVKVAYKDFENLADMAVSSVTVVIKMPAGFTATGITLSDAFTGSTENVANGNANTDGEIKIVKFDATGNGFTVPNNADIAEIVFETSEEITNAVAVEITGFQIDDVDLNSIVLGNGVTAVSGKIVLESDTPVDPTPTPTPPAEDDKPEEPEKVPAFETEVETETKTVAGAKVNVFTATVAPAEGATAEAVSALIVDDSAYQVIFDGKTSKGYAAGWAMATVSGTKLKDALINGGALVDVQIAIGGADEVVVSVLDSEGNTIVLPEA